MHVFPWIFMEHEFQKQAIRYSRPRLQFWTTFLIAFIRWQSSYLGPQSESWEAPANDKTEVNFFMPPLIVIAFALFPQSLPSIFTWSMEIYVIGNHAQYVSKQLKIMFTDNLSQRGEYLYSIQNGEPRYCFLNVSIKLRKCFGHQWSNTESRRATSVRRVGSRNPSDED